MTALVQVFGLKYHVYVFFAFLGLIIRLVLRGYYFLRILQPLQRLRSPLIAKGYEGGVPSPSVQHGALVRLAVIDYLLD